MEQTHIVILKSYQYQKMVFRSFGSTFIEMHFVFTSLWNHKEFRSVGSTFIEMYFVFTSLWNYKWMLQIPGLTSHMGCIGKDKFKEEMKKKSKLAGVNPIVDIKTVLSQLMERRSNYAVSSSEMSYPPNVSWLKIW